MIPAPAPHELKAFCANAVEDWLRENPELFEECAAYGPEWIMRDDGIPIIAGGFMEFEGNSALAWAVMARGVNSAQAFRATRECRRYLKAAPYSWIEAQVADGFSQSLRWVRLLGFEPFGEAFYGIDGMRLHRFVFKG